MGGAGRRGGGHTVVGCGDGEGILGDAFLFPSTPGSVCVRLSYRKGGAHNHKEKPIRRDAVCVRLCASHDRDAWSLRLVRWVAVVELARSAGPEGDAASSIEGDDYHTSTVIHITSSSATVRESAMD